MIACVKDLVDSARNLSFSGYRLLSNMPTIAETIDGAGQSEETSLQVELCSEKPLVTLVVRRVGQRSVLCYLHLNHRN